MSLGAEYLKNGYRDRGSVPMWHTGSRIWRSDWSRNRWHV